MLWLLGPGGFIGGHLVQDLLRQGLTVRAVDIKEFSEWYQIRSEADNQHLDLSAIEACRAAVRGARWIYNLAADMGGRGFIENNKALCMLTVTTSAKTSVCDYVAFATQRSQPVSVMKSAREMRYRRPGLAAFAGSIGLTNAAILQASVVVGLVCMILGPTAAVSWQHNDDRAA